MRFLIGKAFTRSKTADRFGNALLCISILPWYSVIIYKLRSAARSRDLAPVSASMDLETIEKRLGQLEDALKRLGVNVSRSLANVNQSPELTCINNGVIIEFLLRDLWRRLAIKGSPDAKLLDDLRGTTIRKLDEVGRPMPRRIDDYIRAIAISCNRAAHYMEGVTSEDALASLWQLSEVVRWYFETFLPAHDLAPATEKDRPGTSRKEEGLGLGRQGQGQGSVEAEFRAREEEERLQAESLKMERHRREEQVRLRAEQQLRAEQERLEPERRKTEARERLEAERRHKQAQEQLVAGQRQRERQTAEQQEKERPQGEVAPAPSQGGQPMDQLASSKMVTTSIIFVILSIPGLFGAWALVTEATHGEPDAWRGAAFLIFSSLFLPVMLLIIQVRTASLVKAKRYLEAEDYAKALPILEKGAVAGKSIAMSQLGWLYEHGRGVAPDFVQARAWYQKAAERGSQYALEWFRKAAEQGNAETMIQLGQLYQKRRDYAQARHWYEKAAAGGDAEAKQKLLRLPSK
jgi:hypothetical protein